MLPYSADTPQIQSQLLQAELLYEMILRAMNEE